MIDQKTAVHVDFSDKQNVVLGHLEKFEYYAPTENGHVQITINPLTTSLPFVQEMVGKIGGLINVYLISSTTTSSYTIKLETISVSSSILSEESFGEIYISGRQ